jgi:hypothetical protein
MIVVYRAAQSSKYYYYKTHLLTFKKSLLKIIFKIYQDQMFEYIFKVTHKRYLNIWIIIKLPFQFVLIMFNGFELLLIKVGWIVGIMFQL